jgi:hypothetical protein
MLSRTVLLPVLKMKKTIATMNYQKVQMENLLDALLSLLQRPIPKPVPIVIRTGTNGR